MSYSPFHYEQMLLAHVLVYQEEAARYVLPSLTPDKLIYSKEGMLGSSPDHMRLWQAITMCYMKDKIPPSPSAVMSYLGGNKDYEHYLGVLVTVLSGYYRILEFNPKFMMRLAEFVDKAGIMYRTAVKTTSISKIIESPEEFAKAVEATEDPDSWLSEKIHTLSTITRPALYGYRHISVSMDETWSYIQDIRSGKQVTLLPVGFPSLAARGLMPAGKLVTIHGDSNSGKSALTHLINMGTAYGLKSNGIKGCVAVNSLEEDQHSLNLKLACQYAGLDAFKLLYRGGFDSDEYARLEAAVEFISSLPIFIDHTNLLKTSALEYRVDSLHTSEYGPVYQLSVDYLELLDSSEHKADNKEQALDKLIHNLFQLTRIAGLNAIVISQSSYSNGSSKFRIAGASGPRYSRAIQHASDIIIELWNPIEMKKSGIDVEAPDYLNVDQPWLLIEKFRGGPKGSPIPLGWIPENQRFFCQELNDPKERSNILLFDHQLRDQIGAGF